MLVLLSSGVFGTIPVADMTAGTFFWCLQHHTRCWQGCWYCLLMSTAPYQLLTGMLVLLSSYVFSTIPIADRTAGTIVTWCLQHHTSCWQDCWYYCHLVSLAPYELPTGLLVLMSSVIYFNAVSFHVLISCTTGLNCYTYFNYVVYITDITKEPCQQLRLKSIKWNG